MSAAPENIHSSLAARIVDCGQIRRHPDNYNRHDLDKIKASLIRNGQYRPIVVQESTGFIVAGNGTYTAATSLGWRRIAADVIDVDDVTAHRILLVDNLAATSDYDDAAIRAILVSLDDDLAGTGMNEDDFSELLTRLDDHDASAVEDVPDISGEVFNPWNVMVECDTATQQGNVLSLLGAHGFRAHPLSAKK